MNLKPNFPQRNQKIGRRQTASSSQAANRSDVSIRAVLIGLAFIPVNAYLVVLLETVWGLGDPTTMTIFFNAIFCFFLVVGLNLLFCLVVRLDNVRIKHLSHPLSKSACLPASLSSPALSQGELLTIYSILMVSISVNGQDFTHTIFGTLGNARWFATPENEWAALFQGYVPDWLEPSKEALEGYFSGESSFYLLKHIRGWLWPLFWWRLFLTVLCFVMLCINTLI